MVGVPAVSHTLPGLEIVRESVRRGPASPTPTTPPAGSATPEPKRSPSPPRSPRVRGMSGRLGRGHGHLRRGRHVRRLARPPRARRVHSVGQGPFLGSGSGAGLVRPWSAVMNSPVPSGSCSPHPCPWTLPEAGKWADHRKVINTILFRARTGIPWRDLPERYGPWETAAGRHRRRCREEGDASRGEPDGREALGRSRSGLTTKIHLPADQHKRPLVLATRPGRRGDSPISEPLTGAVRLPHSTVRPRARPDRLPADKAYSSRAHRAHLRRRHIAATVDRPLDQREHRQRKGPPVVGLPMLTGWPTGGVTPRSGRSTRSSRTGRSRPATTSKLRFPTGPYRSPRPGSGSAV